MDGSPWNSSKITAPYRRVQGRTAASGSGHPVTTSIRVWRNPCRSGSIRPCHRLSRPTRRPSVGRGASSNPAGLQQQHPLVSIQGRSISDGGTRVVLPVPGGVCNTTRRWRANARGGWEGAIDREREAAGHPLGRSPSCATTVCTAVATDSGWLRITKCRAPSTVVRAACGSLRSR